jgi:hypothetical protein
MENIVKCMLLIMLSFIFGCKNNKPNPALASIAFQRGDLLLCGDGQFGELKFSLSCSYETRANFDLAVALLHSFQYNEAEKHLLKLLMPTLIAQWPIGGLP